MRKVGCMCLQTGPAVCCGRTGLAGLCQSSQKGGSRLWRPLEPSGTLSQHPVTWCPPRVHSRHSAPVCVRSSAPLCVVSHAFEGQALAVWCI